MLAATKARITESADWAAAAAVFCLPWSTTASGIFIAICLVAAVPALDLKTVRREDLTAVAVLPVILWLLAAVGMLWADVSWAERLAGFKSFQRLLAIPILLALYSRSQNGERIIYSFFCSVVILLLVSWTLVLTPGLSWRGGPFGPGVPVRDYIAQGTEFQICALVLIWRAFDWLEQRKILLSCGAFSLAATFLGNMVFVASGRTALAITPILLVLLAWRRFGWKGAVTTCLLCGALAAAAWESSTYLRERVTRSISELTAYRRAGDTYLNSTGQHLQFLKESLEFVQESPVIGYGTGSIAETFHRAAAGKTGAAGIETENPHDQIFAVAIQLGLAGAVVLIAMWISHYLLFLEDGWIAWAGLVIVTQNVLSCLFNSHLFDYTQGWIYVLGVGCLGGLVRRSAASDELLKYQKAIHYRKSSEVSL